LEEVEAMSQNGMARDNSIASLTGSSQQALALNGGRQFLAIENTGNANVGVNITGGTAAIGGSGTITIAAGGSIILDRWVPQNAINVIGTAGQPLAVVEG
jgi:hypothetical protein